MVHMTTVLRNFLAILTLVGLAACASKSVVPLSKPVIRSISIVSATMPQDGFTLKNTSAIQFLFPIAATGYYLDSKAKTKVFNEKLLLTPQALDSILTNSVAEELRSLGYVVKVIQDIKRPPGNLDNIDDENVSFSPDALLHLKFDKVGLFSGRTSSKYLPQVNVDAVLYIKGREDNIYGETIHYGVDAKSPRDIAIPEDAATSFSSFDEVMANVLRVQEVFRDGVIRVGEKIGKEVNAAIRQ